MNGKTRRNVSGLRILAVGFLVFILVFTVFDVHLLIEPTEKLVNGKSTFSEFTGEVRSAYTSGFLGMYNFVSLNGFFARMSGRRTCNDVLLLNNGMLTSASLLPYNTVPSAENVVGFSELLADYGIPFLFVQAPNKIDVKGELLPEGTTNSGNANMDQMLDALRKGGVNALDLRPFLTANPEMVAKNFFKTDHHWTATAAFEGFRIVTQAILQQFPDQSVDGIFLDISQWDRHVLPDWLLGSHGRRVGPYFAGVDDLVYYTPKNDPVMSFALPKNNRLYRGFYADVNLRIEYIEKKPDYFRDDAYSVFIGGNYPLTLHRNASAPSDLKVLLIADSYARPIQGFLSTVFQEIDVVDLRYFKECSMAEYVKRTSPDMVVLLLNPTLLTNPLFFSYGVEEFRKTESENYLLKSATPNETYEIEDGFVTKAAGKLATLSFALRKDQTLPKNAVIQFEGLMADGTDYSAVVPDEDFARIENRYSCTLRFPRGLVELWRVVLLSEGSNAMFEPKLELGKDATPWSVYPAEREDGPKTLLKDADMEVAEGDKDLNYITVFAGLEQGRVYTLNFQNVHFLSGESQGVAAVLYDDKLKQIVGSSVFDVAYCQENGGFSWTFSTPEKSGGTLKLLLYEGMPGATKGIRIRYEGVNLREGHSALR